MSFSSTRNLLADCRLTVGDMLADSRLGEFLLNFTKKLQINLG